MSTCLEASGIPGSIRRRGHDAAEYRSPAAGQVRHDGKIAGVPDEIDVPSHGLVLRRWRRHDAPRLLAAIERSLPELRRFMPWAAETPTLESVGAYLEHTGDGGPSMAFGLIEAGGEVVGGCGLHTRRGPGVLEIGYWVRSDRTGRGVRHHHGPGADRCRPGVLDRVEIRCDPANVASAAIPPKLGYRLDRTDKAEVAATAQTGLQQVWAMARDEYYASTERW